LQRLLGIKIDKLKVKSVLHLHEIIFNYMKTHISFKDSNMNNYILVLNSYMPLQNISTLEDSDSLILITRDSFMGMMEYLRGQSEKADITP
jgi:hypothetical protein